MNFVFDINEQLGHQIQNAFIILAMWVFLYFIFAPIRRFIGTGISYITAQTEKLSHTIEIAQQREPIRRNTEEKQQPEAKTEKKRPNVDPTKGLF